MLISDIQQSESFMYIHISILLDSFPMCEVTQSCPTLCDPMDCSLPGSSAHGIFQARVLDWGAIAFSVSIAREILKNKTPTI